MVRAYVLFVAVVTAGAGCAIAVRDASSLVGTWSAAEVPPGGPPCKGPASTVTYTADGTFTSESANQIVTGTYTARPVTRNSFRVSTKVKSHNGAPNCQGYSAEYVMSNLVSEFDVEVNGNSARVCVPDIPNVCFTMSR